MSTDDALPDPAVIIKQYRDSFSPPLPEALEVYEAHAVDCPYCDREHHLVYFGLVQFFRCGDCGERVVTYPFDDEENEAELNA